ncbi:MAG: 2-amino-4-hydroxy-6-hydroxymethyldihydropteridine diphosphokinase [Acidimicrobiales bacterium]
MGLGSNLGDRRAALAAAVEALPDVVAVSPLYESDPVGGPAGQGPYLNAVVELMTERGPRTLLETARALEAAAGRVRGERWGPRTLDVDVLLVGDLRVDEADLVVPHPRISERAFVLVPLADLAPDIVAVLAGANWRSDLAGLAGRVRRAGLAGSVRRAGSVRPADGPG